MHDLPIKTGAATGAGSGYIKGRQIMTQLLMGMAGGRSLFRNSGDLAISLAVSLTGLVVNLAVVTAGVMVI